MAGSTPERGGQRIVAGRYRLVRKLGLGGMGRVWLAYDQELTTEVSIKEIVMPPAADGDSAGERDRSERIARARSEARNAARLRGHPHVVTVHDVVVHDGLPWIVMEFVPDAVDLQALVRSSGPLSPQETARIGLGVLDALTFGHRIGILHRDVKPANILLAPDSSGPYGRVLLTDYGIALRPGLNEPRLTATAGILGTPGYLAPERAHGDPPTPAADLFSLGATLYTAVEGRGAFDRDDNYAMLTALLTEPPAPPVRAGELLGPVLLELLRKNPLRRSAPETVAHGLERVRQGPVRGFGPVPPYGIGGGGIGPGAAPGSGTVPLGAGASTPGGAGGTPPRGPYDPRQGPHPYPYEQNPYARGGPGDPHTPGTPGGSGAGTPTAPATPGTPGTPGALSTPGTPGIPGASGTPATPGAPDASGTPGTPGTPEGGTPGSPGGPGNPGAPGTPGTPGTPGMHGMYETYGAYREYGAQGAPGTPNTPGAPGTPSPFGSPSPVGTPGPTGTPNPLGTPEVDRDAETIGAAHAPGAAQPPGPAHTPTPDTTATPTPTPGPPPGASASGAGGQRRPRPRKAVVVGAVVLLVLAAGGTTWAVLTTEAGKKDRAGGAGATSSASRTPSARPSEPATGSGGLYPYGADIGLTKSLTVGDCVNAVWTSGPFSGQPNIGVADCANDQPDGQAMAVARFDTAEAARQDGAAVCRSETRGVVDALPDAASYPLIPTAQGFDRAGGEVVCLVLGRHTGIGSEVGRFRDIGLDLPVPAMAVGDCWNYKDLKTTFSALLTDCTEPHTDQVVGSVGAPAGMTFKRALDNVHKLCGNRFEAAWAPGAKLTVLGRIAGEEEWNSGFNKIVCTVGRADGKAEAGKLTPVGGG
ncbi:protein kinase [Streptomyces sp. NPDC004111]|uniref:serine/threonine-protein kinase n=1 Tax=Streptomyces sp. NPDC004111 TaxID=3364690 RepID=UPI0036AC7475